MARFRRNVLPNFLGMKCLLYLIIIVKVYSLDPLLDLCCVALKVCGKHPQSSLSMRHSAFLKPGLYKHLIISGTPRNCSHNNVSFESFHKYLQVIRYNEIISLIYLLFFNSIWPAIAVTIFFLVYGTIAFHSSYRVTFI